jgi:hypothetical protein
MPAQRGQRSAGRYRSTTRLNIRPNDVWLSETTTSTSYLPGLGGDVVVMTSDPEGVPLMVYVAPFAVPVSPCGIPVTDHVKAVPSPPVAVTVAR